MTLNEFKSWLEGFADSMGGPPNADQWAKIEAKLSMVTAVPFGPVIRSGLQSAPNETGYQLSPPYKSGVLTNA